MPTDTFDPRTALRADYEREKSAMLLDHMRRSYAPQAVVQAAALVRDGNAWRVGDGATAAPATPAQAPAAPAVTADLDALRQADAVAVAARSDREMRERHDTAAVQTDARAMDKDTYAAALAKQIPSYVRRF